MPQEESPIPFPSLPSLSLLLSLYLSLSLFRSLRGSLPQGCPHAAARMLECMLRLHLECMLHFHLESHSAAGCTVYKGMLSWCWRGGLN